MKKLYWITVLVGILIISGGTLFVKVLVNYYSGEWNIYAVGKVAIAIYAIGIMVGIISNSLFQEVIVWIQKYLKK